MAVIVPRQRPEHRLWRSGLGRIRGVDEVGVAPPARPSWRPRCSCGPTRARSPASATPRRSPACSGSDSPQDPRRSLAFGVGAASVAEIDRLNIYHASISRCGARSPASAAMTTSWSTAIDRRLRGPRRSVHLDRRWRRHVVRHRMRLDRRQGGPRSADDAAWPSATRATAGSTTRAMPRPTIGRRWPRSVRRRSTGATSRPSRRRSTAPSWVLTCRT